MDMDRELQLAEQDAQGAVNMLHELNNGRVFIVPVEDIEDALRQVREAEFRLESVLHEVARKRIERQG